MIGYRLVNSLNVVKMIITSSDTNEPNLKIVRLEPTIYIEFNSKE
jgi:hypothetical protein